MIFINKQHKNRPSYLIIDHSHVVVVDEFKQLGITFVHNLFFNKYVARESLQSIKSCIRLKNNFICLSKSKFNSLNLHLTTFRLL